MFQVQLILHSKGQPAAKIGIERNLIDSTKSRWSQGMMLGLGKVACATQHGLYHMCTCDAGVNFSDKVGCVQALRQYTQLIKIHCCDCSVSQYKKPIMQHPDPCRGSCVVHHSCIALDPIAAAPPRLHPLPTPCLACHAAPPWLPDFVHFHAVHPRT